MKARFVGALVGAVCAMVVLDVPGLHATPPSSGFVGTTIAKGTFGEIQRLQLGCATGHLEVVAEERRLAFVAEDQGKVGPVHSEQYLGGRGDDRLAQPSRPQPDHHYERVRDRLRERERPFVHQPGLFTATASQSATLVDEGGEHVHQIVNTGTTKATGYAVQLIPAGATRRIEAPQPQHCPF